MQQNPNMYPVSYLRKTFEQPLFFSVCQDTQKGRASPVLARGCTPVLFFKACGSAFLQIHIHLIGISPIGGQRVFEGNILLCVGYGRNIQYGRELRQFEQFSHIRI